MLIDTRAEFEAHIHLASGVQTPPCMWSVGACHRRLPGINYMCTITDCYGPLRRVWH
ncbi:hypothetical protein BYT27DRAFT_7180932 [Phlegmacium glaucopus]|nr:hypothetical protein BYT27DRAFT_7180932 [Phlegmacium glaucopus]